MAKRRRNPDSDGTTTQAEAAVNTVFIDTILDTHLALIVSDFDTVADLKEKIMFEHPRCFPEFGEIKVHALKVKRRGNFYHLSDSMLVKSAFEVAKKNWFISVDALSLKQPSENLQSYNANATGQLSLLCVANYPWTNGHNALSNSMRSSIHEIPPLQHVKRGSEKEKGPITDQPALIKYCNDVLKGVELESECIFDENCKTLSSDVNGWSGYKGKEKHGVKSDENKSIEINAEEKDHNSEDGCDVQYDNSEQQLLRSRGSEKKRSKTKKGDVDAVPNHLIVDEALKSDNVADERKTARIQEGSKFPFEEDGLISDSNKEISKCVIMTFEKSADHKQKSWSGCDIEKHDVDENKLIEINAEDKQANSKDAICDVHRTTSEEKLLRTRSSVKRRKTKKHDADAVPNHDVDGDENKLIEINAEDKQANSKDGICDVHCNTSEEQLLRNRSSVKRRKTKKHDADAVPNHLSVEDALKTENLEDKKKTRIQKGSKFPLEEDVLISDSNKESSKPTTAIFEKSKQNSWPGCEVEEKHDVVDDKNKLKEINAEDKHANSKDGICDVHCNTSEEQFFRAKPSKKKRPKNQKRDVDAMPNHLIVEEALKSDNNAEKVQKPQVHEGSKFPLEDGLISDYNKESLKQANMIFEISAEHKQNSEFAIPNSLTEPSEIDSLRDSSGSKKKKRKKKAKPNSSPSLDQVVASVPSIQDVGEKSSMQTAHTNLKLTDVAIIPREDVYQLTLSEPLEISQKQKHNGGLQKVAEEDNMLSFPVDKNIVLEYNGLGTNKNDKVSENIELTLSNDPEKMLSESGKRLELCETDVNTGEGAPSVNLDGVLESRASGVSKRKAKVKKFATRNPDALGMKQFNNALSRNSSTPTDSVNNSLPVETTKYESIAPQADTEQSSNIENEKELSFNNDAEVILSKRLKTRNHGKLDVNTELPIISADLPDTNKVRESSGGSRQIKKRAKKKSVARNQEASDMGGGSDSGSGISIPILCPAFHDGIEEKNISYAEGKVEGQQNSNMFLAVAGKEGDHISRNEAKHFPLNNMDKEKEIAKPIKDKSRKKVKRNENSIMKNPCGLPIKVQVTDEEYLHPNQIDRTLDNAEELNKFKKKTKKNQKSAANSTLDIPLKEKEAGDKKLAASKVALREVDSISRATNITSSSRRSSRNQLIGPNSEHEKSIGMSGSSVDPQSGNFSLDLSAHALEDSSRGRSEGEINAGKHMEDSQCEGDDINFKHYFVFGKHVDGVSPADEVEEARSDRDSKIIKKAKKVVVPHVNDSPAMEGSLKLYESNGSEKKSRLRNSCNNQIQRTSSKDDYIEVMHQSNKEARRDFENGIIFPPEGKEFDVANSSRNKRPAPANSSSIRSHSLLENRKSKKCKSSLDRYHVSIRKPSGKNTSEGGNSSQQERRLLTTPAAIFKDGSSRSSTYDDATVDSDTSNRSPSDKLSSSGYSERESMSNLDSPTNGPNGPKTKDDGGKLILNSQFSGSKNITMDMILRRSSRFKAKLTASKSQQEDTESQPAFVPDSQPNL